MSEDKSNNSAAELLTAGATYNYELARAISILQGAHRNCGYEAHKFPEECPLFIAWERRRIASDGHVLPEMDRPSGTWVGSGLVTPEEVEEARPVLDAALARGEKSVVVGSRLWVHHEVAR